MTTLKPPVKCPVPGCVRMTLRWPGLCRILGIAAVFLAGLILGLEIGRHHRSVEAFAEAVWMRWAVDE